MSVKAFFTLSKTLFINILYFSQRPASARMPYWTIYSRRINKNTYLRACENNENY